MTRASLGIGLLGLGLHGRRHAAHLAHGDVPGARLAATWTRSPERGRALAEQLGAVAAESPEAVIERPDVDAVVIVVPVGLHRTLVEAALAAGKAVLVEKPMAPSRAEARALERAAEAGGATLTIGHTLRFDPLLLGLSDRARDPSLGRLAGFAFEQRLEPRGVAWEDVPELAGGGVLLQTGIHAIDALRFVSGAEVVEVHAAVRSGGLDPRCERAASVIARLEGGLAGPLGAVGTIEASKVGRSRHHRYRLFFEEGGLEADFVDRRLYVTRGRERAAEAVAEVPTVARLLGAFVAHVRGEGPNPVPAAEGAAAVRVVDDAYARAAQA